ncbi:MAG: 2Fe-2S iron-sulfur cluster-binding protein [SAR202 cluster bacterium]|jgi:2Fe-2S ferredoxin|nr:2Fe-2S iron-sulfur cluster-binding protein [SAR202 cluster bacterium]|tara:strand:- start:1054 stop:1374 length:321 start_codon:yes stop_codon:yes gene_type:complete
MPKITYIEHSKKKHTVEVSNGMTIMDGAIQNNIPGIDAECGGGCACATCQVYVDEKFFNKLPIKESAEEDMLDMAYKPNKFSRLSCQVIVTDDLNGLVANIPLKQY